MYPEVRRYEIRHGLGGLEWGWYLEWSALQYHAASAVLLSCEFLPESQLQHTEKSIHSFQTKQLFSPQTCFFFFKINQMGREQEMEKVGG